MASAACAAVRDHLQGLCPYYLYSSLIVVIIIVIIVIIIMIMIIVITRCATTYKG